MILSTLTCWFYLVCIYFLWVNCDKSDTCVQRIWRMKCTNQKGECIKQASQSKASALFCHSSWASAINLIYVIRHFNYIFITAYRLFASELWQYNMHPLRLWCMIKTRASELDNHQNQRQVHYIVTILERSKYADITLIHMRHTSKCCCHIYDKHDILLSLKHH